MNYVIPHYYKEFHCIAGECPDTCCAGWEIAADGASLKRYRKTEGPLGNRLSNSIRWREGTFRQYKGRCAFLNEENLCDLYIEGGRKMLCRTCRMYPRHVEEFEGVREISLCLSCIRAAEIILGCREKVRFLTARRRGKEEDYGDFDFLLYTKLEDARELALGFLQDRGLALEIRMAMALSLAHDLQRRMDKDALFEADGLFERYRRRGAADWFKERLKELAMPAAGRYAFMDKLLGMLKGMEVLNPGWPRFLGRLASTLYGAGPAAYERLRTEFYREQGAGGDWEIWGEQLMVYFVFTYFCGAVYDGRAYTRMKLAVMSTLIIREMALGLWACRGRALSLGHMADIAHRYSRELEHSDENKEYLMGRLEEPWDFRMERTAGVLAGIGGRGEQD